VGTLLNDEEKLIQLITNHAAVSSRVESIRLDTHLIDELGFDSVSIMSLIVAIEQEWDITIDSEYLLLEYFATPGHIFQMVRSYRSEQN